MEAAVALSDQDFDNIEARFKSALLTGMAPDGVLPCSRHDDRMTHLESGSWKGKAALAILVALAGFMGAAVSVVAVGAMFDRAANQALSAPAPTQNVSGGP